MPLRFSHKHPDRPILTGEPPDWRLPGDTPRTGGDTNPALSRREVMLGRFAKHAVAFLKKEDGPTAVEYAITLALIVVVVITVSGIGGTTNSTYSNPALVGATKPAGS